MSLEHDEHHIDKDTPWVLEDRPEMLDDLEFIRQQRLSLQQFHELTASYDIHNPPLGKLSFQQFIEHIFIDGITIAPESEMSRYEKDLYGKFFRLIREDYLSDPEPNQLS